MYALPCGDELALEQTSIALAKKCPDVNPIENPKPKTKTTNSK